jgi:hypothetical protein
MRPIPRRRGPARSPVVIAVRRRPVRRPPLSRQVWIALLSAAFSVLVAGGMAVAAVVCADDACQDLAGAAPARTALDLSDGASRMFAGEPAPVRPGRPPTATPAG